MKHTSTQFRVIALIFTLGVQLFFGVEVYGARELNSLDTSVRVISSSTVSAPESTAVRINSSVTNTATVERVRIYRESFETVLDARDRYRKTSSLEDKKEFETRARMYLKKSIEEYLHRLQATITWIDSHPRGSVAVLAGARLELSTKISQLQNVYAEIDAMSYDQIRDMTLRIKQELTESRSILRSIIERLQQAQLIDLQQKVLTLTNTIDQKLSAYEARGYDMTQAHILVEDIRTRLSVEPTRESIAIAYTKARELLNHLKQVLQQSR